MKTFREFVSSIGEAILRPDISKPKKAGRIGGARDEVVGKKIEPWILHGHYKKIGKSGSHELHAGEPEYGWHHIAAVNPETKRVDVSLWGRKRGKTFHVHTVAATGEGPKAHDFYRHVLKTGHVNALVGSEHSPGGQKVWQRLAKHRDVEVHGWHRGKAVNLDPSDPEQTHATKHEREPEEREVARTKLVASLKQRK